MRKSKLESYEDILGALVKKPSTIDAIAFETTMNCMVISQRLNFLMENGLVEERAVDEQVIYAITERGAAVFKVLNFQRYLETVVDRVRAMDEAIHIIPAISEDKERQENRADENENY
jgi:predicted transcriptional regulator